MPVQNTIESNGHITRGAALGLKARLELYLGKYEEAQASALEVISMPCYELYPEYEKLFWPEAESSNKESILDIQYMKNDYSNMIPQLNFTCNRRWLVCVECFVAFYRIFPDGQWKVYR